VIYGLAYLKTRSAIHNMLSTTQGLSRRIRVFARTRVPLGE